MLVHHVLLEQPSSEAVREARLLAGLTQSQAAQLVSSAQGQPYRTWQGYEAKEGSRGHRAIPAATWSLFLLLTEQHPAYLIARKAPSFPEGQPGRAEGGTGFSRD